MPSRRARLVEFFWGWPDPALVATVHEQGALVSWQVGSREEAVAAAEAGSDLIVAQGVEAGGHVRGTIGVLALLDEVLAAVDVPCSPRVALAPGEPWRRCWLLGPTALGWARASSPRRSPMRIRSMSRRCLPLGRRTRSTGRPFDRVGRSAPRVALLVAAAEAFPGDVVGEVPSLDGTREALPRLAPQRDQPGRDRHHRGDVAVGRRVGRRRQHACSQRPRSCASWPRGPSGCLRRWGAPDQSSPE